MDGWMDGETAKHSLHMNEKLIENVTYILELEMPITNALDPTETILLSESMLKDIPT